jgi:hypothetical protein
LTLSFYSFELGLRRLHLLLRLLLLRYSNLTIAVGFLQSQPSGLRLLLCLLLLL